MKDMVFKSHEWTRKPLKQLVEQRVFNYHLPKEVKQQVFDMTAAGYDKKTTEAKKKELASKYVTTHRHELRVKLLGDGERQVSSIDQMVRETHYAESWWGIKLRISVKEPKKLNNIKLLYFGSFDKVTVQCKRGQLEEKQKALIKPAYQLINNRARKGLDRPLIMIQEKGQKPHVYNPEDHDERPEIVIHDQDENRKVVVRGKMPDQTVREHVYEWDRELLTLETIEDFAQELVTIDTRYGGDIDKAKEDLKSYYYNHKKVITDLRSYYLEHKSEGAVSFEQFVELVKEMEEEAPLYPFSDILEEVVEEQ